MNYLTVILLTALFQVPLGGQKDSTSVKPVPESLTKLVEQIVRQSQANNYEIEIDGLLVDDTKTKTGKDFYDLFYGGWEVPAEMKNYTITISEKPFRLSSTLIVVFINDTQVYQSVLQPRFTILEVMAQEAIATTLTYLANYEEIMRMLNGEDMTGSGIY
ncbi:MAG: CsgE family curli-type amyloid fiber assembly protein [Mangrovibacterium sp.]